MRLDGLSCSYRSDRRDLVVVFRDVSITLTPGRLLGVFGPNGCGKSSLLRTVLAAVPSEPVGWIPQEFQESLFPALSLNGNLALVVASDGTGRSDPKQPSGSVGTSPVERVRLALGIEIDLSSKPRACSIGMLQQAAILRALASRSRFLLADEPFSALDANVSQRIYRGMRSIVQTEQRSALIVSHDLLSLRAVCDEVLVIPGRPFSTTRRSGMAHAVIVPVHRPTGSSGADGDPEASFLHLAQNVLEST